MATSCLNLWKLEVSDDPVIDASVSFCTDSFPVNRSIEWSMKFIKSGTDGDPILTIEVSNDDVNWTNPYEDLALDPITFTLTEDVTCAFDSILPFRYIRVCGDPNGTTTGTIEVQFVNVADA